MMEADLAAKTDDIDLLSNLVDEYLKSLNIKQNPSIIDKLNKLKTVRFSNYTHWLIQSKIRLFILINQYNYDVYVYYLLNKCF